MDSKRRFFLSQFSRLTLFAVSGFANALETPHQSWGPFYPKRKPLDSDSDLTFVVGREGKATGEITNLYGQVLRTNGEPLPQAQIEIWQCDAFSTYHHPLVGGGVDPYFQGYGKTIADNEGRYRFKTIKPVAYPGRAPHIHFRIAAGSMELVTQIYVQGHPANEIDFLLNAVRDHKARQSLIIPFTQTIRENSSELTAVFNPVIG